ncbi:sucrase ferredoxin [Nocardia miyunensis]|uniref:sucrase ferredoxin n=1 Tax=Nocardia miyunensis TaxID=282684 RepID=UPI000832B013|nr:sucrase ferredoxin [Nocardia miyunensis]
MTGFEGMSCSAAAAVDIPLPGSATRVSGWLCVEHPGAWGRDVIGDEVLGARITTELAARTKAARVRPTLIRRPGRSEFTGARTVLLAATRPEGSWCERLEITDLEQLLDLDLHLLNGPAPGIGVPVPDPVVLVCAHGKRDQCCALLGRPIAARLAAEHPEKVWECSHTGGHRFAPAMVLLPSGLTYGRVDADAALEAVAAVGRNELSLDGFRGRSCYAPVEQVAEIAVRERLSPESLELGELAVTPAPDAVASYDPATFAGAALVTHRDGRRWLVTARTVAHAPRQASCGAAPKPAAAIVAGEPRLLS